MEASLKSLIPRPKPFINSGIFLPPNNNKTMIRMIIISDGPIPKISVNKLVIALNLDPKVNKLYGYCKLLKMSYFCVINHITMLKKIEHIGIAVKDLENSNNLFKKLFGKEHYKIEKVESEGVSTSFFMLGETKIELVAATNSESSISKFIEKKGEGIHHIAYAVDDIISEMERLKNEGFELINQQPKDGADNKLICFLHPKSTNGVLVELCQEKK